METGVEVNAWWYKKSLVQICFKQIFSRACISLKNHQNELYLYAAAQT